MDECKHPEAHAGLRKTQLFLRGKAVEAWAFGPDSYYIPGFLDTYTDLRTNGLTVDALTTGDTYKWIDRHDKRMLMRGHALNRTKLFAVDDVDNMPLYRYTGWQWASTDLYVRTAEYPVLELATGLMANLTVHKDDTPHAYNHLVLTKYTSHTDCIGYHSDKTRDFVPGSPIALLSLGAWREFHLKHNDTGAVTPFIMSDGDLFFMGWDTNQQYTHSLVPVAKELRIHRTPEDAHSTKPRVSVCFRAIQTRVGKEERLAKIQASLAAKSRTRKLKRKLRDVQ